MTNSHAPHLLMLQCFSVSPCLIAALFRWGSWCFWKLSSLAETTQFFIHDLAVVVIHCLKRYWTVDTRPLVMLQNYACPCLGGIWPPSTWIVLCGRVHAGLGIQFCSRPARLLDAVIRLTWAWLFTLRGWQFSTRCASLSIAIQGTLFASEFRKSDEYWCSCLHRGGSRNYCRPALLQQWRCRGAI